MAWQGAGENLAIPPSRPGDTMTRRRDALIRAYIANPHRHPDALAAEAGFKSVRHVKNLLKNFAGMRPKYLCRCGGSTPMADAMQPRVQDIGTIQFKCAKCGLTESVRPR